MNLLSALLKVNISAITRLYKTMLVEFLINGATKGLYLGCRIGKMTLHLFLWLIRKGLCNEECTFVMKDTQSNKE